MSCRLGSGCHGWQRGRPAVTGAWECSVWARPGHDAPLSTKSRQTLVADGRAGSVRPTTRHPGISADHQAVGTDRLDCSLRLPGQG